MTGWPSLTEGEAYAAYADKEAGRHWSGARCWCEKEHGQGEGLVAPPWAAGETTGEGK